jgi:hypothetical protein
MRRVLMTIATALTITLLCLGQTNKNQKPAAPPKGTNPEWVQMDVTLADKGATYLLTAKNPDGGAIETSKANVEITGKVIKLRVRGNTDVQVVKTPAINKNAAQGNAPKAAGDCVDQAACSTKCGACFPTGYKGICIRVCCGTGGTRGIASGLWGCP